MKYIAVILSIFGIEFGLKEYIERNKIEGVSEKKLGGTLLLRKHHNKGAFLNAGQNKRKVVAAYSGGYGYVYHHFFFGRERVVKVGAGITSWRCIQ